MIRAVKIDWEDYNIMYSLCFNNWNNIEKLSNKKVTFKIISSVDWTMWCEIKTKHKTINIKESTNYNYMIGIDCFLWPEIYKQKHFSEI